MRLGDLRCRLCPLPRRRVGQARPRRRPGLRAADPGSVPVGSVLADDPAQARELPRGLLRLSIPAVAAFGDSDVERLLGDAGIVRNRAKIEAAIANARAALELPGGVSELVWRFADPDSPVPALPRRRAGDHARLQGAGQGAQKAGVPFVGPTTSYALMQAIGLVDDHIAACWTRARTLEDAPDAAAVVRPG